ncbi:GGDEF domain-containing protein [Neptuniibacter halophilus]|uniref:GGDEF domain-containing protein n=1 Tax=Neptuniibacter halophilus TaxID=651666 RepID=UPI002573C71F|nr:sensor domain-containing diguanylate cyclase [Neptuniibacter halophilus]
MNSVDETVLVSLCPDPVIGVDGKGVVRLFNAAAERLLGYAAAEVIGLKSIAEIYPSLEEARAIKRMIHSDQQGAPGSLEGYGTNLVRKDGQEVPIRLSAAIVDPDEGSSIGFFHDLTERKKLEQQLHRLSVTDELTGLFNQRYFYQVMGGELERAKRYRHPLSLICFDLDHFKKVNDLYGHLEGDRVLKIIGDILSETLRSCDVPVRYGGDEFMILLPETGISSAAKTAERIRHKFNQRCPYAADNADGAVVSVSISLGVTESNGTENPDQIVQRADLAMYESKNSGGNSTVLIKQHLGSKLRSD